MNSEYLNIGQNKISENTRKWLMNSLDQFGEISMQLLELLFEGYLTTLGGSFDVPNDQLETNYDYVFIEFIKSLPNPKLIENKQACEMIYEKIAKGIYSYLAPGEGLADAKVLYSMCYNKLNRRSDFLNLDRDLFEVVEFLDEVHLPLRKLTFNVLQEQLSRNISQGGKELKSNNKYGSELAYFTKKSKTSLRSWKDDVKTGYDISEANRIRAELEVEESIRTKRLIPIELPSINLLLNWMRKQRILSFNRTEKLKEEVADQLQEKEIKEDEPTFEEQAMGFFMKTYNNLIEKIEIAIKTQNLTSLGAIFEDLGNHYSSAQSTFSIGQEFARKFLPNLSQNDTNEVIHLFIKDMEYLVSLTLYHSGVMGVSNANNLGELGEKFTRFAHTPVHLQREILGPVIFRALMRKNLNNMEENYLPLEM